MKVVLAPDKFKGSLTAAEVAAALSRGLRSARPGLELVSAPVADGGDGTTAAAVAAGFGRIAVTASGPTGERVHTAYARRDDTAVVELADVCGLARLPHGVPAPMDATSRGLGEVMAQAVAHGATRLIVGIGGSASTDGGRGMLDALSGIDRTGVEIIVASDVTNPLLGPGGAAAVYAPQKGASPAQVAQLEERLAAWADEQGRAHADTPGAGAAGGVGYALLTLGATLRPGIEVVLDLIGFAGTLRDADLVITGEGSLDAQTLHGKAPSGVADAARHQGIPVVAVCGTCTIDAGFDRVYALHDLEPDRDASMRNAAALLEQVGATIAANLSPETAGSGVAKRRSPGNSAAGRA